MSGWNPHQQKIVDRVISDWDWLIAREQLEWYSMARPYAQPPRRPGHKFSGDCAGTVKLINCSWSPIPPWDGTPVGFGNTATFANNTDKGYFIPKSAIDRWQPLDLLLYKNHSGPFQGGASEHVTQLLYKKNGVWMCGSMGGNSGPTLRAWNYRRDLSRVLRFPIPLK